MSHCISTPTPRLRRCLKAGIAGAGLALSMSAMADLSPALDRISVSAGAFDADPEVNASLNTQYGNFQTGDLQQKHTVLPRVRADLIIFDSQGLAFDYYQYKRDYTGAVAGSGNVGGNQVNAAGDATVGLKLDLAKLAYKWWFGSGNTVMGLGVGGAYYKAGLNARANAVVNGSSAAFADGYSDDAIAPLVEFGLRHAFSADVRVFLDASGVKKSGGKIHGEITNAALGAEWFVVKNVGLVVDYNFSRVDLTRNDVDDAHFRMKFSGPSAFVKVRF